MRADSVHVRHASVEMQMQRVNVVIGVVLGELLVVRVVPVFVCDDAVVHRTLVLIAFHRSFCFHVEFPLPFFCIWRYSVLHSPSVTVNCCELLPNFHTVLQQINSENHTWNKYPNHFSVRFP